jgi:hypothetical protein
MITIIRRVIFDIFSDKPSSFILFSDVIKLRAELFKYHICTKIEDFDISNPYSNMINKRIKFYVKFIKHTKTSFDVKHHYIMKIGNNWDIINIGPVARCVTSNNYANFIEMNAATKKSNLFTVRELIDSTNISLYWYDGKCRICTSSSIDIEVENTKVNGVILYHAILDVLENTIGSSNIQILLDSINPINIKNKSWCMSLFIAHPDIHPVINNNLSYRLIYDKIINIKNKDNTHTILYKPLLEHPLIERRISISQNKCDTNSDFIKNVFLNRDLCGANQANFNASPLGFLFETTCPNLDENVVLYIETKKGILHRNTFYNPTLIRNPVLNINYSIISIFMNCYYNTASIYDKYFLNSYTNYNYIYKNIVNIILNLVTEILCFNKGDNQDDTIFAKIVSLLYVKYNTYITHNKYVFNRGGCCQFIIDTKIISDNMMNQLYIERYGNNS